MHTLIARQTATYIHLLLHRDTHACTTMYYSHTLLLSTIYNCFTRVLALTHIIIINPCIHCEQHIRTYSIWKAQILVEADLVRTDRQTDRHTHTQTNCCNPRFVHALRPTSACQRVQLLSHRFTSYLSYV